MRPATRTQILAEIRDVRPTLLPSVPRIFEKLYTAAQGRFTPEEIKLVREVGGEIEDLKVQGLEVPVELTEKLAPVADKIQFVRDLFGGRLHEAVTGAAPIATEILEFFWGAGVPVLEGYGMTETSTSATYASPADHRFGTVGKPYPGVEIRIADDGEILISGDNVFHGYYKQRRRLVRRGRRRLAAHRRPRQRRRRRLPDDHGPQEGPDHHRRRQEHHAGQHRERDEADPLGLPGRHARRPARVPGDARHARRGGDRPVGAGSRRGGHVDRSRWRVTRR